MQQRICPSDSEDRGSISELTSASTTFSVSIRRCRTVGGKRRSCNGGGGKRWGDAKCALPRAHVGQPSVPDGGSRVQEVFVAAKREGLVAGVDVATVEA